MQRNVILKRLLAVLRAAIYGAVLFDAMIVANNVAYETWGHGRGLFADWIGGLGWILVIPSAFFGGPNKFANVYLVNGLLGAIMFSLVAAFWQFAVKDYERQ